MGPIGFLDGAFWTLDGTFMVLKGTFGILRVNFGVIGVILGSSEGLFSFAWGLLCILGQRLESKRGIRALYRLLGNLGGSSDGLFASFVSETGCDKMTVFVMK